MPARPSAEIRAVEVQKLRTFYDFCGARATLCGDSRGRGSKTADFLRFLACARDPLRRFAWSRFKNCGLFTIFSMRARPSAEIRVVEVQKLRTFYDFCKPRATLCGDRARRSALAVAPCEFVVVSANPLRRLSRGLRACFRNPAVAGSIPPWSAAAPARKSQLLSTNVVRGACSCSSGWKIVTFKYRRSVRSVLPQLRLENRNF